MKQRQLNTVRTDTLERKIAFYQARGKDEAAEAIRSLARDIAAPVSGVAIAKLMREYHEADQVAFTLPPVKPGREVIKEKRIGKKTYRLESIRCGKSPCKCEKGKGHGPYWYAYWSEKGRTKSAYIGKELKTELNI